jgi:hypothetical protein
MDKWEQLRAYIRQQIKECGSIETADYVDVYVSNALNNILKKMKKLEKEEKQNGS